jgi:hypothetical protein
MHVQNSEGFTDLLNLGITTNDECLASLIRYDQGERNTQLEPSANQKFDVKDGISLGETGCFVTNQNALWGEGNIGRRPSVTLCGLYTA